MRHPLTDHGRFAIVGVLAVERAPRQFLAALAREEAHGPTIEATLDELADWIEPRVGMRRAEVAGARYRVVVRRA